MKSLLSTIRPEMKYDDHLFYIGRRIFCSWSLLLLTWLSTGFDRHGYGQRHPYHNANTTGNHGITYMLSQKKAQECLSDQRGQNTNRKTTSGIVVSLKVKHAMQQTCRGTAGEYKNHAGRCGRSNGGERACCILKH